MRRLLEGLIRIALFGMTLFILWQVIRLPASPAIDSCLLIGGMLLVFPVVWIGRMFLNRRPAASHTAWIVTIVHYLLMILFGAAVLRAIASYPRWPVPILPIPAEIGLVLVIVTGAALLLTVINLALKGFGAPFAIALSRKLAMDWMYAWTRNPMALALLAFLLALGIWFQSALFVLWIIFLVTPAWLAFLIIFEERELEIRFEPSYLEYKSKTPMLFPRRPKC
jgi:protein-S-isoprenylcysteine O-methyltransferase Ste14